MDEIGIALHFHYCCYIAILTKREHGDKFSASKIATHMGYFEIFFYTDFHQDEISLMFVEESGKLAICIPMGLNDTSHPRKYLMAL